MSLNNPASRSALRSIVFAIAVMALLAFAYIFSFKLTTEAGLREVLRYCFVILFVSTLGYITETGIKSIKAKGLLGDIEMGTGDAAQTVADSAQATADTIKDAKD